MSFHMGEQMEDVILLKYTWERMLQNKYVLHYYFESKNFNSLSFDKNRRLKQHKNCITESEWSHWSAAEKDNI